MKKKVPFVATFAVGMLVGVISQRLVYTPITPAQTEPPSTLAQTEPKLWDDSEEGVLKKMQHFQDGLDDLGKPDSVEALSNQTVAQQGIVDILAKYREAKNAKFAPYITGGVAGGIISQIIAAIGAWLIKRKPQSTTDGSVQAKQAAQ